MRLVAALWLQLPHLRTTTRLIGYVLGQMRGGAEPSPSPSPGAMRSGGAGRAALQDHRHPTPPQLPLLTREGTPERLPRANAVYSSHLSKRRSESTEG